MKGEVIDLFAIENRRQYAEEETLVLVEEIEEKLKEAKKKF